MAAIRMDGKALAAKVKEQTRQEAAALARRPGLAVILVGDDPASRVYVNSKRKDCEECGFYSEEYALLATTSQEELLAACQRFHYGLVALHVRVQMAAAYGLYGQPAEARAALEQALAEAAPDGFWMPLAENYRYLAPLLAQGGWGSAQPLVERAIALGQRYEARRAQLNSSADRPAIAAALTEKELALARLVAQRRTNKEIAETLHLSEGTVKQYINQLYAKLDIGGAVRNKRAQLAALFGTKY